MEGLSVGMDNQYYVVGIVKKFVCFGKLVDFKGKCFCYSGYGRSVGWIFLVLIMIDVNVILIILK